MAALSEQQLEEIWNAKVRGDVFAGLAPSLYPVLISVGAQPGAGKTAAGVAAEKLYPNEHFVFINGDDLRQYHPEYQQLLTLPDPQAMPNVTAEFSGWMVRRAIAEAAENTYSARVEETFRQARTTLDTVRTFREHGFETPRVLRGGARRNPRTPPHGRDAACRRVRVRPCGRGLG